jgi:3-hydroxybutyryl-CoA dehydrogenase
MPVRRLAVVGAGTMGRGITQTAAQAGLSVVVRDVTPQQLEKARGAIEGSLAKTLEREEAAGASARLGAAMERICFSTDWSTLGDADFAIEAVNEQFEVKREVFLELEKVTGQTVVLATNTSSISITRLAAALRRPDRVIGMHFMNPVPRMKLVEVIRALQTSDQTCAVTRELAERLGKTPVEVKDFPGFVSNRVLMPMLNEAMFVLYEGVGTAESIDAVMILGMNHPMGPLRLADLIGLDVCLDILNVLYDGFRDPKYRPCPLLTQTVAAGYLGRKSGRGFYRYDK